VFKKDYKSSERRKKAKYLWEFSSKQDTYSIGESYWAFPIGGDTSGGKGEETVSRGVTEAI